MSTVCMIVNGHDIEGDANTLAALHRTYILQPELLDELKRAHEIITTMLNRMTDEAKSIAAKELQARGIIDDGLTRYHERAAAIAKAEGHL